MFRLGIDPEHCFKPTQVLDFYFSVQETIGPGCHQKSCSLGGVAGAYLYVFTVDVERDDDEFDLSNEHIGMESKPGKPSATHSS